jgi:hypothetical protein
MDNDTIMETLSRVEAKLDEVLRFRDALIELVSTVENPLIRKVIRSKLNTGR